MTSAKKIRDLFKTPRGHTKKGNAGYDNARENIDPHVKTKVITTSEGSIQNTPTADKHITNKKYVDDDIDSRIEAGTAVGQVTYWDASSSTWLHTETSELFWDDVNKRLGLNKAIPVERLDIDGNILLSGLLRKGGTNIYAKFAYYEGVLGNFETPIIANMLVGSSATSRGVMVVDHRTTTDNQSPFSLISENEASIFGMNWQGSNTLAQLTTNRNDGDIAFSPNNTPRMYIKSGTGRVGIGTATPTEKLHVVGNGIIDGTLNATGTVDFDSTLNVDGLSTLDQTEITGTSNVVTFKLTPWRYQSADMAQFDGDLTDSKIYDSGNFQIGTFSSTVDQGASLVAQGSRSYPALFVQGHRDRDASTDIIMSLNRYGVCGGFQVYGDHSTKIGGTTNFMRVDGDGKQWFEGTGGLCFGGISMYDNATADSIATATSTQLVRFDTNDPSNNCTPDHTSDDITIIKAGMYMVTMSVAFSGTGSVTWTGGVYKNNGATQLSNLQTHRKLGASGDVGSATVTGIADFAANDTVEIWFMQSSGVNKSITVKDCTLSVVQVGGT